LKAVKLLVIDDLPDVLEMISTHFSMRGYEVLTSLDGREGLELAEAERPDIVLLDLKMKKLDGDRFLEEARKKNIASRVIVITGCQDELLRKRVESLGVDGFIEKPASILELQSKIEHIMDARK